MLIFIGEAVAAESSIEAHEGVTRIAYVSQGREADSSRYFSLFRERLQELGYVEGRNLTIEAHWAEGHTERLPALMREVVSRNVAVIVTGATPGVMAAKSVTQRIPIIATSMADPVATGLVASLARPGGNVTGLSMGFSGELAGKWIELLQEIVPGLRAITVVANLDNAWHRSVTNDIVRIAPKRGIQQKVFDVRDISALQAAFLETKRHAQGMLLVADAVTLAHQQEVTELALKHRVPVLYNVRLFMDKGGLISYGPDLAAQYRRLGDYVDKVLKGAKPGDLPIEQPTKFELVINVKTAKALGITIPESILLRADEVIR
jgi:putative ABC transport system substrate-binding protein